MDAALAVIMPTKPYYVPVANPGVSTALPPFELAFKTRWSSRLLWHFTLDVVLRCPGDTQIYNREGGYCVGAVDFVPNPVLAESTAALDGECGDVRQFRALRCELERRGL